jgi:hypothetical protein
MFIAAAAAAGTLAAVGSADAGEYGYGYGYSNAYSGGYEDGYSAPCGCQGYGYDNYGYEGNYDIPFLPSESYGYSSYGYATPGYGERYGEGYGYVGEGYDYDRSYYGSRSYDYDSGYQPRHYSYRRTYHYAAPRYSSRHYNYRPRVYGHTSRDGERG